MPELNANLDTLIIDTSATMIIVADLHGRIIRLNEFGARMLGYETSDLLGKIVWDILPPPEFKERAKQRYATMLAGETVQVETVWLTRGGQRKCFSYTAKGVPGPDGKIAYAIGIAIDISARVAAETALRESEEHFRTMFNDAAVGMALVDEAGHYIQINRAFCELTGYDENELRNFDLLQITHPDDRQRNSDFFQELAGGRRTGYVLEKRYIRRNGETIWVQVSASLAGGGHGRPATMIGLFENISERRAAQQVLERANVELAAHNETLEQRVAGRTTELQARSDELVRSKQELLEQSYLLRSILDSMSDAVYVADASGNLVLTNPAAARISGPIRDGIDEVVGRANQPWFFQPDGTTRCLPQDLPLMRSARGELVDDQELMIHRPGSAEVWIRTSARPLLDKAGNQSGTVAVARDVTERKRHEAALQEANRLLRESERHYKDLADSNLNLAQEVKHRVRNNLQGLLGLVHVMRDNAIDVRSFADALEARLSAMEHVHQLLADTKWEPVGMRSLIDGILSTLGHMAPCQPTETQIAGPDVLINPRQVLPLTLVLVEWFTNSCKYGAHSVVGGQLEIDWRCLPNSNLPRIRLTWTERGGPPIKIPVIASLGSQLVREFARRELAGSVELKYPLEGADHTLEFTVREDTAKFV